MNFSELKDFFTGFNELPVWFQIIGLIGFVSGFVLLIVYIWTGMNLKKEVFFEVRLESNERIGIRLLFTGPKKNVFDKYYDPVEFSEKLYYGTHKVSAISEKFQFKDETYDFKVSRYNDKITFFLKNAAYKDTKDVTTMRIVIPGSQIQVRPSRGDVVLFTEIKSVSDASNRPLCNLTQGNFEIEEFYKNEKHPAPIREVRPIASPFKIIVAADVSGSMKENIKDVKKAIQTLFDTLANHLAINENSRIAVRNISGNLAKDEDFFNYSDNNIWFPLTKDALNVLVSNFENSPKEGNTPLWDSVRLSLKELLTDKDDSYKVMIVLSDGFSTRGKDFESLMPEIETMKIPIFTVGYKGDRGLKKELLEKISSITHAGEPNIGSFMADSISDIEKVFKVIADSLINTYEISWRPTGAEEGEQVDVIIKVSYKGQSKKFIAEVSRTYIAQSRNQRI